MYRILGKWIGVKKKKIVTFKDPRLEIADFVSSFWEYAIGKAYSHVVTVNWNIYNIAAFSIHASRETILCKRDKTL